LHLPPNFFCSMIPFPLCVGVVRQSFLATLFSVGGSACRLRLSRVVACSFPAWGPSYPQLPRRSAISAGSIRRNFSFFLFFGLPVFFPSRVPLFSGVRGFMSKFISFRGPRSTFCSSPLPPAHFFRPVFFLRLAACPG